VKELAGDGRDSQPDPARSHRAVGHRRAHPPDRRLRPGRGSGVPRASTGPGRGPAAARDPCRCDRPAQLGTRGLASRYPGGPEVYGVPLHLPRTRTSASISSVDGKVVTGHLPALRTTVEEELQTPHA
jgi:hypothetical protein